MPLVFNSEKMFKDMVDEALVPAAQEAMKRLVDDFKEKERKFNRENKDFKFEDAVFIDAEKYIKSTCTFYALSVMSSFGRGTEISTDNKDLEAYLQNAKLWNPDRSKSLKEIVGRPSGNQHDDIVTGKKNITSRGIYEGKKVPGSAGWNWKANYAIQNAVLRMKNSLDRIISESVSNFLDNVDLSKYLDDSSV